MGDYTGVMIALVPTAADTERLAVPEGLPAADLHTTLGYYGELDDLVADQKNTIVEQARMLASNYGPFTADAFNVSVFNPNGEDPCIVLGVSGVQIAYMFADVEQGTRGIYTQRRPHIPHITLRYTPDASLVADYTDRTGPVTYDKIRVGFGGDYMDFPLNPQGASITAAVNSSAWHSMPVAPRETTFNADDAIARGLEWAGGSASKFNSLFLYRRSEGDATSKDSYRLPIADIIGGKPTLIPRAVFSAAVILSGGHGGLEGVVTEESERRELKQVLTEIYDMLQDEYQDPRVVAPWLLGKTEEEQEATRKELEASVAPEEIGQGSWSPEGLVASVRSSGWSDMPLAEVDHPWDGDAARKRVWDWADGDFRQYRKAFLWSDAARPEQKNSYKLPIADVVDGSLKIVPRAVNAVAAVLAGARGGVDIPDADMDAVQRIVNRIQARWQSNESETAGVFKNFVQSDMDECGCDKSEGECGCGDEDIEELAASAAPVYPPSKAFQFDYSNNNSVQPFTVQADGSASGLLWMWNKCHAGIVNECVLAPRTATNYAYFHNGQVLTSDGQLVKVGKITMGTGHAGPNMRWIPAADHYDNTGTAAVIGRVTETAKGGWFDGVLVSSLSDEKAQELRRSPISGDWRRINGNLELVAALAVNTPGFPIVASLNGETQSLVAAGMMHLEDLEASADPDEDLTDTEKDLVSQVDALDDKITLLAQRGRARKWGKLMAALDSRGGK